VSRYTAISAVVPRKHTVVAGTVSEVRTRVRPWVRCDVDLCDGTGTITLRFIGRTEIAGIVPGCHLKAEGTPSIEFDRLIMLNPLYTFCLAEPRQ
jgi:hypothetical protein